MCRYLSSILPVFALLFCACSKDSGENPSEPPVPPEETVCDVIPDFSMVGYKYGDVSIPSPAVRAEISLESVAAAIRNKEAEDTTSYFQSVIDKVGEKGGTILIKNGTYNVSSIIFIDQPGVVLRGESRDGVVIMGRGKMLRPVFAIGKTVKHKGTLGKNEADFAGRVCTLSSLTVAGADGNETYGSTTLDRWYPKAEKNKYGTSSLILGDYVPVGSPYVKVEAPAMFAVGDEVAVCRPHSPEWISDVGMDKIASNGRNPGQVIQWSEKDMTMYWTRRVTTIKGNKIYLDAPLVQALDRNYGGGRLYKYTRNRISGCGVENLTIDSSYDPSILDKDGVMVDEAHAWVGICTTGCEDCWVRSVTVKHTGYGLVDIRSGSRCITVENCAWLEPVSVPGGARRYGYCLTDAELCLIKDCTCEKAAIGFACNGDVLGPNVFTNCEGTDMQSMTGPHLGWATGTLYDCVRSDNGFVVEDRGNSGTGHGWIGANTVFWNVETAGEVKCYSPWSRENTPDIETIPGGYQFHSGHPSAQNYAVGAVCAKKNIHKNLCLDYYRNPVPDYYVTTLGIAHRPDGVWYPYIADSGSGTQHISLPDEKAAAEYEWWPELIGKSYSQPLSLYQCQLEDRRAKGIVLAR